MRLARWKQGMSLDGRLGGVEPERGLNVPELVPPSNRFCLAGPDHALNLDPLWAEMDNESQGDLSSAQIVQELYRGEWIEYETRFRLDDHPGVHHHVGFVAANRLAEVKQLVLHFMPDPQSTS